MSRVSLKIVGASGQGINSIGEVIAKAAKRAGYSVFGYREYPSLIKGGHASYQLDVATEQIRSSETKVNLLIALNHHGLEHNVTELKPGGIIVHVTPQWIFPEQIASLIERQSIGVLYVPVDETLEQLKAKPILANVLLSAFTWALLKQDSESLKQTVGEKFAKKKDLLELNMRCIDEGFTLKEALAKDRSVALPKPAKKWRDHLLITGSEAMGLGAVHAGVRLYAGYPMTPSSPLLGFIAGLQNTTGMIIKQAEDEITAAQMISGAMFMGCRALTATSGGGFDLMSETLSLNGIIENPTVFVLAQRPGPATGLPTWTAQGELLYAIHTAHGEFTRCVLAVSDAQTAFELMPHAFNLAEEFQISVIVLTDKHLAEALFTQPPFDQKKARLHRGIVTDPTQLKKLKATDRYDPTAKTGVSKRWLPGAEAATYCAQGDEHNGDGTVDESAANSMAQTEKRMRKLEALKRAVPEPEFFKAVSGKLQAASDNEAIDVLLVSWGSNKGVILDVLTSSQLEADSSQLSIGYLHFTYLWPLKTETFEKLAKSAKRVILVECNYQGQLGVLLKQQTGIEIKDRILKYDGRPFFYDELVAAINGKLQLTRVATP